MVQTNCQSEQFSKIPTAMRFTDWSQSPIFSWDRWDIPRLTVTAILIFKCTEGTGVGDYSSSGGRGREKYNFSRFLPNRRARPLSSFNTHARWQPVTQSARSRWSYGKNRGLWTVYAFHSSLNLSICDFFCICCVILTQSGDQFRIPKQTFKNKNKNTICFLPLLIVDTTPTEHVKTGLTKLSIQWAEKTFLYPRFTY